MKPIQFQINGLDVLASHGETILEAAVRHGIQIDSSCEGGACGVCRVVIKGKGDQMAERNLAEAETAQDRGFTREERLACQSLPISGLEVWVPLRKDP